MQYPFRFEIVIWEEEERKYYNMTGMGLCDNFVNAMEILEDYYKDELVSVKHLELFADSPFISLPKEVCDAYAKADFPDIDFSKECDINGAYL